MNLVGADTPPVPGKVVRGPHRAPDGRWACLLTGWRGDKQPPPRLLPQELTFTLGFGSYELPMNRITGKHTI